MGLYWDRLNTTSRYFIYMHFAELLKLEKNQTREFNVYRNGELRYQRLVPDNYTTTLYNTEGTLPNSEGRIEIWLNSTSNATLPPLINALEIYQMQDNSGQETYETDGRINRCNF